MGFLHGRVRMSVPALAVLLAAGFALTGCGESVSGKALASYGDVDPGSVAGLPVTNGPSGLRKGVPTAKLDVEHDAHTRPDTLAVDTLSDVYDYWSEMMPRDFGGQRFRPPSKLVSFDSTEKGTRVCGTDGKGIVNAMYCPKDNSVNWDRGVLLPFLIKQFGPLSVVTVLSHEMGHAVQFQLGSKSGITRHTESIVLEQQADCYAGSFIRWAAQGHAKHFQISTGRGLNTVLAAIFLVRDKAGKHSAHDKRAHGSAFDRVYAFQTGFAKGPKRCARIDMQEINDRVTEDRPKESVTEQNNGNLPVNTTTVDLLRHSLNQAFHQQASTAPKIRAGDGHCADGSGTPPASYCPQRNTVVIDKSALRKIAELPDRTSITNGSPNTAGGIGDFAAFAEIASRYAMGVEHSLGISIDDSNAGLRTSCLTGAWAKAAQRPMGSRTPQLLLAKKAGDLDEAIAELLTARSVISADVKGSTVPSGFARVASFRAGFLRGSQACTKRWP